MSTFIPEIANTKNWGPMDAYAFHFLPSVPYLCGVYETSVSAFAERANMSRATVRKFFERLSVSGYVEVLRLSSSGRYSGIAFMRDDSTLHKNNYRGTVHPFPSSESILYPRHRPTIHLPKNFFRSPLTPNHYRALLPLLSRDDMRNKAVHAIIHDYLTSTDKQWTTSLKILRSA